MVRALDKEKIRVPNRNRTHDLLPGVPEVTDLIPVGKSQFFFSPPPCHVNQFTFHSYGIDTRSTLNKTGHSLIIKMVVLNVIVKCL